jgi:hypothetical protein
VIPFQPVLHEQVFPGQLFWLAMEVDVHVARQSYGNLVEMELTDHKKLGFDDSFYCIGYNFIAAICWNNLGPDSRVYNQDGADVSLIIDTRRLTAESGMGQLDADANLVSWVKTPPSNELAMLVCSASPHPRRSRM